MMYRQRYYDSWLDRLWNDTAYRIKVAGIIFAVFMVLIGIYTIVTYRKTVHTQVIDISWELKIDRLQYQTVNESAWHLPSGARLQHKEWEVSGSERYISGYETKTIPGGTYSCGTSKNPKTCRYPSTTKREAVYSSRPTYDWKYYYDIDRWRNIQPLITSGKDKEDVHWPDITDFNYDETNIVGNVKLGTRYSHYQIIVSGDGQTYPVDMVEAQWRTYGRGTKASLTLGFFNNVLAIEQERW